MLDAFLEVMVKNENSRLQEVKLANDLKRLPNETLYKIATGDAKLSFGYSDEWLEKYKGTSLFEQAMELEKADLEAEIAREQLHANQPDMSQFWKTQDQIRLQKKMLDLQLIEMNEKDGLQMQPGGMLPESITPTAQGAGALGDVAAEGAQQGEAGKMAAANFKKMALSITDEGHKYDAAAARMAERQAAEKWELAQKNNAAGSAHGSSPLLRSAIYGLTTAGGLKPGVDPRHMAYVAKKHEEGRNAWNPFGGLFTPSQYEEGGTSNQYGLMNTKSAEANFKKTALQMGDLAGYATKALEAAKASPMASKALQFAAKNPAAVGAGVGAVGGAIAGGPGHRLSGAAGGAALGAGVGAAGGAIAPGYKTLRDAGLNRMDSFTTAARGAKDNFVANMKERLNVPAPAPVGVKNAEARFKLAAAKLGG